MILKEPVLSVTVICFFFYFPRKCIPISKHFNVQLVLIFMAMKDVNIWETVKLCKTYLLSSVFATFIFSSQKYKTVSSSYIFLTLCALGWRVGNFRFQNCQVYICVLIWNTVNENSGFKKSIHFVYRLRKH